MNNFHVEAIQIDGREPHLKVSFEDVVDKDVVSTWLNSQGFLKKVNVNEDEYCKVSAIVYLYSDADVDEIKEKLVAVLQRYDA